MTAPVNNKEAVIKKITSGLGKNKQKAEFAEHFLGQVPPEDFENWEADDLKAIMNGYADFATTRKKGEPALRIFRPNKKEHGWEASRTVIEIINGDRPFLIDSIASLLTEMEMTIEVLFHPIVRVTRDKNGKMEGIFSEEVVPANAIAESCIHVQLEQLLPKKSCADLEKALHATIDDVLLATGQWQEMMSQLKGVVQEMSYYPTSLDVDDVNEARALLQYLHSNNFTFLGYRRDQFEKDENGKLIVKTDKGSGLGLLHGDKPLANEKEGHSPEAEALVSSDMPIMVGKLVDQYATVHRRVPMDTVSVKVYDLDGNVQGQHLFLGLLTSSTYSCRTNEVPLVRRKVKNVLRKVKASHDSHDYKALEHILEKFPRDELFQIDEEQLFDTALGILRLQERRRVALFTRLDPMERYVSALVYVPRDRFNSDFRRKAVEILENRMEGNCTSFHTTLDDSPLARILLTILLDKGGQPTCDIEAVEEELIEVGRVWGDGLKKSLITGCGKEKGMEMWHRYGRAFAAGYEETIRPDQAVHDILHLEHIVEDGVELAIDTFRLNDEAENQLHVKIYNRNAPVRLSDILPTFEKMGLECESELPYKVTPIDMDGEIWIHDFSLSHDKNVEINLNQVKEVFEEAFLQIWDKQAESDGLNSLILRAGLNWREVNILRAYTGFLKQGKYPFSRRYIEQVLADHALISKRIVGLFKVQHDPMNEKTRDKQVKVIRQEIETLLQQVEKLDHDRILRSYYGLVQHTLRTNYYQTDDHGAFKPWLSMKLDSKNITELPLPRPDVEIYVYSTRVEAVHLRGGKIARGGLRWSDRHDDFRTEILGLMKAQMVKNAVIVPVGSKGGFIVKQPPAEGGRDAFMAEGVACYETFIQALLDITDNNVKGKVVPPKDVVRRDGDDPYLVVAADKGTATFSDYANALSNKAGFWLGDAFASGGSAGYDHKAMGITARGAWESVKRHFRELGKNIQEEDFTAIGVGDMGGDVFGNGMLLSKHIRLQGAFNHLHIFCDPDPDSATSFKERKRLFDNRMGWDQYNTKTLSKGAMIYERSAKEIKLTPEIKKCFGLDKSTVTPNELIRAMLVADVELLWFGGIGTYIKSSKESHADADDKNNDAIRINGRDLNASVIGEGANLGVTQLGRIEASRYLVKCNTDFIDNSAGVDCSDHEVNIKILLSEVMQNHDMDLKSRDKLLAKMTDNVSELVLKDNYQQTQALSFNMSRGAQLLPRYADFIRDLEKKGVMNRAIEFLPEEEEIQRMIAERKSLTQPELSVLLSYAKIVFYNDLLASDIPDDEGCEHLLYEYFPDDLQKYKDEIADHRLRREIIATGIANSLINRMGPVFVTTRMENTGANASDVVRAYMVVLNAFDIKRLWKQIEMLDNKVPVTAQLDALKYVGDLIKWSVTWLLKFGEKDMNIQEKVAMMQPQVQAIQKCLKKVIPADAKAHMAEVETILTERGIPAKLAGEIAILPIMVSACDIIDIQRHCQGDIKNICDAYFKIGEMLEMDWLRDQATNLVPENQWQNRVLSGLKNDLYIYQATITSGMINEMGCPTGKIEPVLKDWTKKHERAIKHYLDLLNEIHHAPTADISMLILAEQQLSAFIQSDIHHD